MRRTDSNTLLEQTTYFGGKKAWSAEDDAILVAGDEAGDSTTDIAQALGRTPKAVEVRRVRLALRGKHPAAAESGDPLRHRRQWSRSEKRQLVELRREGLDKAQIAAKLGRSIRSVEQAMSFWASSPRRKMHQTPSQRAATVALANEKGARLAAKDAGVAERSVVRWRNGHTKKVAPAAKQPERITFLRRPLVAVSAAAVACATVGGVIWAVLQ